MTLKLPAVDRVRDLLLYDQETGLFFWRKSTSNSGAPGKVAGSKRSKGYVSIGIDGTAYRAHRLAWLYMTGSDPGDSEIDHKDRNKANNTWSNLRLATRKQNNENIGIPAHNTSGIRGVSFLKSVRRWEAYVYHNKRRHHLGHFVDIESAAAARKQAEARLFTHSGITGGSE